jgi:hypothetical protein
MLYDTQREFVPQLITPDIGIGFLYYPAINPISAAATLWESEPVMHPGLGVCPFLDLLVKAEAAGYVGKS